jgi:5,6-dimethylbenzimidazole synthase
MADSDGEHGAPDFDAAFREKLAELFAWRRDVRRFRPEPVDPDLVTHLIAQATLAPSVGFSQPWRFVLVENTGRREAIRRNFERCNAEALATYTGERAETYAGLKLAGLREAPVHLAVFADAETGRGQGLGRLTMPEMLPYSVVTAVYTFWLAARAAGVGVGWVSILDPAEATQSLDVPATWRLIAYLCVGYPAEEHKDPELERHGWESRIAAADCILRR